MDDFFAGVRQHRLTWRGEPLALPVFCRDNRTLGALFTASTHAVRPLMPVPGMALLEWTPGRCLVAVHCFEYRDTDIGPYNEVVIAFLVRPAGLHAYALSLGLQLLRARVSAYVWQLPVTTAVAMDGGKEIYGYPKFLADVSFAEEAGRVRCTASADGEHILTLEGSAGSGRALPRTAFVSYSMLDGIPLMANILQNPIRGALHWRPRDARLALGDRHPVARALRGFGLSPRPLMFAQASEHQAILFAARNLMDV